MTILNPITRLALRIAEKAVSAINGRINQLETHMSVTLDSINAAVGNLTAAEQSVADAITANTAELSKLAARLVALGGNIGNPGGVTQADLDRVAASIQAQADSLNGLASTLAAADAAADAATAPAPSPAPSPAPAPTPEPSPAPAPAAGATGDTGTASAPSA